MLISQILIITVIQQLSEMVVDPQSKPHHAKLVTLACYAGSFSLIVRYVFTYVLNDLVTALQTAF